MTHSTTIEVLWLRANGWAEFVTVKHTLDELQRLVDGYLEPLALKTALRQRGLLALVNEEGLMRALPVNLFSFVVCQPPEIIVGDAIVLQDKDEEFASVTAANKKYLQTLVTASEKLAEAQRTVDVDV